MSRDDALREDVYPVPGGLAPEEFLRERAADGRTTPGGLGVELLYAPAGGHLEFEDRSCEVSTVVVRTPRFHLVEMVVEEAGAGLAETYSPHEARTIGHQLRSGDGSEPDFEFDDATRATVGDYLLAAGGMGRMCEIGGVEAFDDGEITADEFRQEFRSRMQLP